MLETTTISELRANLSEYVHNLKDEPLLVLSRSKPAAYLMKPELFEALVERIEQLEDIIDGRIAVSEYLENPDQAVDADEILSELMEL
ncbi:MAG: type II toxin-antitoxin system prevent-host-death family antitoxin [Anaerolineaceae bacterium]|nr:type II toxin-antitoxin system prevent-host-death family antitoxin [Anaerolineaceae bacterium]